MIQETEIKKAFEKYTRQLKQPFQLKGIFFDMDGVLFDSMPLHAKSWILTFAEHGLVLPEVEPYMNEGSTAFYTVRKMFKKHLNQDASDQLCEQIKNQKHKLMSQMPKAAVMSFMPELLQQVKTDKLSSWVVTGSAQEILINRLLSEYEGVFIRENMITALDVKNGKPDPEPYLKAMLKSGYQAHNSIVIENAPLGVESAKAAGLFTIAINTGPLPQDALYNAGADIVLSGSEELNLQWPVLSELLYGN